MYLNLSKSKGFIIDYHSLEKIANLTNLVLVLVLAYLQAVIAYVTLHSEANSSAEDIELALQAHLAVYAVPQVYTTDPNP